MAALREGWVLAFWVALLPTQLWAANSCPHGATLRNFKGERGEPVVLCQTVGSAQEPDLYLDPVCSAQAKGCEATELRKLGLKRKAELLKRISKGEFRLGRNAAHVLCTEGGGALVYLSILETGSQMVACRLKDQSLIAVDSLGAP